ncbi:Hsp33 family molecular chaperone HslO [Paenibacillus sp. 1P07SE]|uniref:Hsp33 family molecular chaperone HslO n=1 Tax=Paenibacillus sp. 1P07SE TaxID=3132209 RepID=UPI0039A708FE
MTDIQLKGLTPCSNARLVFTEHTELLGSGCRGPHLSQGVRVALARLLAVAGLTTGFMKDNERVTYKIKGSDRSRVLFAEADDLGHVRGYVSDACLSDALVIGGDEIGQLTGTRGCVQVLRDIGMQRLFTGITDMPYGTITDDLAHYYSQSEQTPTFFWSSEQWSDEGALTLGRGIAIQLLPGAPLSLLHELRTLLAAGVSIASDPHVPLHTLPALLFGMTEALTEAPLRWYCDCSRELFYPMLYALDRAELQKARFASETVEFVCHKCGAAYTFSPDELTAFL